MPTPVVTTASSPVQPLPVADTVLTDESWNGLRIVTADGPALICRDQLAAGLVTCLSWMLEAARETSYLTGEQAAQSLARAVPLGRAVVFLQEGKFV